ncbi:hypothetical protein Tco_0793340 [Tanacetum coccineum]
MPTGSRCEYEVTRSVGVVAAKDLPADVFNSLWRKVIRGKSARNDLGSRLSGTYIFAQSTLYVPNLIGETLEAAKQCDLCKVIARNALEISEKKTSEKQEVCDAAREDALR